MRKIEDADILEDFYISQQNGMSNREYMRQLYEQNKTGKDLNAFVLKLDKEEDADIIASIERAESLGMTPREWLRNRIK